MERLTYWQDGTAMMKKRGGWASGGISILAAYEDTGLEPEEVRRLQKDWTALIMTLEEMGGIPHIRDIIRAEQDGRLLELPFVAMVEQSLQDGKMKPMGDQKHNGRYAVVYVDHNKWKSPLIDICGKPYNREEAENRMAALAQKVGDSHENRTDRR